MSVSRGKVLLAMSGGVDSSVSAVLLREQGYEVVGCFMRLGSPGETLDELTPVGGNEAAGGCDPKKLKLGHQGCCSVSDAADARLVAAQLGIPFYVVNFKKDFGRIMDYFADEYAAGRTPNPCVRCNDWLKFGKLREYAGQIGAEFVASGHYARVVEGGRDRGTKEQRDRVDPEAGWQLMRGLDQDKDQSYVLFGVPREHLGHMLLPVGGLRKSEVRRIAEEHTLPVFNKPDSQEICFVPDNDYAGFVGRRRPGLEREGDVLDAAGRVVGKHGGHHRFTIGQRRGVGVALGYPIFVMGKDPERNTVTVGPRESLLSEGCVAGEVNWLAGAAPPGEWTQCWLKYRYNMEAVRGRVRGAEHSEQPTAGQRTFGEGGEREERSYSGRSGRFEVRFESPQEAVTPGQAVVVYGGEAGEVVWGGGWIV